MSTPVPHVADADYKRMLLEALCGDLPVLDDSISTIQAFRAVADNIERRLRERADEAIVNEALKNPVF